MPPYYTPARAAAAANVHPNSIRTWCKEYGAFLSPGANPPAGQQRQLTAGDVAVLQTISQLRNDDYDHESIAAHLRQMSASDLAQPFVEPSKQPPTSSTTTMTTNAAPAPSYAPSVDVSALMTDLAVMVDNRSSTIAAHVDSVDQRLQRLERQRVGVVWLLVGLVAGLVAGGLLVSVLLR